MRAHTHPHSRSTPARSLGYALMLAGLVMLGACHQEQAAAPAPRPVVVAAAHADGSPLAASLPGEVQARYSTPLSFRIAGKIVERHVRLGDTVKLGEVVARLDPADAQKSAASALAQLDAAQHGLVFAKQQLDRDQAQARENLISAAQLEQTTNAYASALAQRDQAAQQAALQKNQLQYTDLLADHAGVITAENAQTGQNVSSGQAVYNLAWSGDIDVVVDVPESTLGALAVGQTAKVTLAALPGRSFNARVRELSPAADPQSRTYRANLTLLEPSADVRLGMTADVALNAGHTAAQPAASFTLPATALFHDGTDVAVWVVHNGNNVLELRHVQVTRYDERTVAISGGLKDGERVVLQGVHTVTAGETVHPIAPLHPEDFAS
ncbi:multidrug efflux system membrane fusion protein [Paraburkholderia sp. GAS41]|jgi:multidrug efflux system membrane fusion protein|uniref:efflux RND transporter periplasmic adaptor subunit n=1 Tax=Paraburkholderia sp. GAS41 TaxID=3035134 RepID=UPI003D1ECCD5